MTDTLQPGDRVLCSGRDTRTGQQLGTVSGVVEERDGQLVVRTEAGHTFAVDGWDSVRKQDQLQ